MTHPADVQDILRQAAILVGKAEATGVTLRITAPMTPLRMAENNHVIDAWPARNGPKKVTERHESTALKQAKAANQAMDALVERSKQISDREWAARDPSLREGSSVRVPGVGEL